MTQKESIRLFEERKVRAIWDDEQEEWYFSIVDVISILTDSPNPRKYWSVLKTRMKREGSELTTNCSQLKMQAADGKKYLTDVADYKRLGYSDNWINQRLKSIEIRKDLTDEWKKRGLEEGLHFATLTDIIYKSWSDMTSKEYKRFKGLRKENLRDNMTNKELVLNMLAELSTKEISEASEPDTFSEHINVAQQGGEVARNARLELEAKTGKSVISPLNAQKIISLKKGENERDV